MQAPADCRSEVYGARLELSGRGENGAENSCIYPVILRCNVIYLKRIYFARRSIFTRERNGLFKTLKFSPFLWPHRPPSR